MHKDAHVDMQVVVGAGVSYADVVDFKWSLLVF